MNAQNINQLMLERPIPSSGRKIPVIGLGTSRVFDIEPKQELLNIRKNILDVFYSNGGRLIDTSPMYGMSEEIIGLSAKKYIKESDFKGINPADLSKTAKKVLSTRFELVMGEIEKTSKKYISKKYGFKISLLHLDLDTYSGKKSSLINFFPKVSKGGIIILDEYGNRGWGETDAVDEFFEGKNYKVNLLDNTDSPTGYIVK
jgi:hypothetical protein